MSQPRKPDPAASPESDIARAKDVQPASEPSSVWKAKKLVAVLGVCTALLTLLSTGLGVLSVNVNQKKDQAEDRADSLSIEVSQLSSQVVELEVARDALANEIADLEREKEGLVRELEAAANEEGSPPLPASEAIPSTVTYLSDERMLNSYRFDTGTASVSGQTFVHSVRARQGRLSQAVEAAEAHAEYDLGKKYDKFTATLGLSDTNRIANRSVKFEVLVDNEQIYEKTLTLGEAEEVQLEITGGLRLRLQVTFYLPDGGGYDYDRAVWGDAALVPTAASS